MWIMMQALALCSMRARVLMLHTLKGFVFVVLAAVPWPGYCRLWQSVNLHGVL
jgi:hypothetical protein